MDKGDSLLKQNKYNSNNIIIIPQRINRIHSLRDSRMKHVFAVSSFWMMLQLWLLLITLLLSLDGVSASYMITLAKGSHECFVLRARSQVGMISGNYDCLEDEVVPGMIRAELWVDSHNHTQQDVVWHSHEPEGIFYLPSQPSGKYSFCLYHARDPAADLHRHEDGHYQPGEADQHVDDTSILTVGFNIRLEPPLRSLESDEKGPDALRALSLVQEAANLELYCTSLLDHFEYLRQQESVHHYLADVLLKRVMQWTMVESTLVVLMAVAQVWYFTKFFEQTRYL